MTTPATYAARFFPGAFFLYSGLNKRKADSETAKGLQEFAAASLPQVKKLSPETFTKLLSTAEIATAAALLTPFVPNKLAGLALTGFGAGFMNMYLRTPGMTQEGSVAPSENGMALAKDSWLLGTGVSLLLSK